MSTSLRAFSLTNSSSMRMINQLKVINSHMTSAFMYAPKLDSDKHATNLLVKCKRKKDKSIIEETFEKVVENKKHYGEGISKINYTIQDG